MENPTSKEVINVAVVGGGMGGLCLAIALLQHSHIKVHVYEAAHKFSEIGAGVSFGPNAQRALRLIGKSTEEAYLKQRTTNGWKEMENVFFEYRFGMGPKEGELIATLKNETGQCTVHRAKFLDEFVSLVPKEICHFGKRLTKITETPDAATGIHLDFQDGTTAEVDAVFGCDGVHSVVRAHLLGEDNPLTHPRFTTSVAYRGLVPMEEAVEAIGDRYARNSSIWVGVDGCVMIYPIDFGKTVNIVAINSSYDSWNGPWVQPAKYETITKDFANFGPHVQKIIGLLDRPETSAWSMWDMPPAPTYFGGNVVMTGDAAHATTPFQGQGAGQAIEDAYVLGNLMGRVEKKEQISMAFKAYDKIRRPRSQKVCTTSREAGELCALRLPSVKDNAEAFKENISWRMDWMWHRDVAGEFDQALAIFQKLVSGEYIETG